jgi:hypothetical protein
MQVEFRLGASKNTNPLASLARVFFPLTDLSYILGQLFPDLASTGNNFELLAIFVSVLKNLSTLLNKRSGHFPVTHVEDTFL